MPEPRTATPPPAPTCQPAAPLTSHRPLPATRRPFQFGMRSLLILVTAVALISPLLPNYGRPIAELIVVMLTHIAAPVCLVTAAVYCRGIRQTFFIGAALPSLALVLAVANGQIISGSTGVRVLSSLSWLILCALSGWLAVATRHFLERRGWHLPEEPRDPSPPR